MTTTKTPGMPVEEGNRLICEFMGWRFDFTETEFGRTVYVYYEDELRWIDNEKFLISMFSSENGYGFHLSWEKLMPVVEKIEITRTTDKVRKNLVPTNVIISKSEGWEKDDLKQTCTIIQFTWDGHRVEKFHKEKIIAVWLAVVHFIQWYNTQTSKQ